MDKTPTIHKAPTACVIRMLENSVFHSLGKPLSELARSPIAVETFRMDTSRTLLDGVMHVISDGKYVREMEDVAMWIGKIISFSCDQDAKNIAALSFLQKRMLFFHVEFDLCHRYVTTKFKKRNDMTNARGHWNKISAIFLYY